MNTLYTQCTEACRLICVAELTIAGKLPNTRAPPINPFTPSHRRHLPSSRIGAHSQLIRLNGLVGGRAFCYSTMRFVIKELHRYRQYLFTRNMVGLDSIHTDTVITRNSARLTDQCGSLCILARLVSIFVIFAYFQQIRLYSCILLIF